MSHSGWEATVWAGSRAQSGPCAEQEPSVQRCGKKANVIPAAFPEPRGEVGEGPGSRTAEEGAGAEGRLQGLRGVSLEGDRAET